MNKSTDRAAATAALFSSSPPAEPVEAVAERARADRTARVKRVRRTVDLAPAHHHQLTSWCEDAAVTLGAARVSGQDVISALVAQLLTDETLARKIRQRLADEMD